MIFQIAVIYYSVLSAIAVVLTIIFIKDGIGLNRLIEKEENGKAAPNLRFLRR